MRKYIVITLSLFFAFTYSKAQFVQTELISSAGNADTLSELVMCWSLGEVFTEQYSNDYVLLTPGFQQTGFIVSEVEQTISIPFHVSIFPNPATTHVNLKINDDQNHLKYNIDLIDMQGRTLQQFDYKNDQIMQINIQRIESHKLILKVTELASNTTRIFKLLRTHH